MKPLKLVMSAFGSYGGMETIDFTRVERGIFLITGDTGAGKTTVFDAISYALYDETSGGKRSGDMMRSQYAGEDLPTFVELTFSCRGKVYVVKRNPNYRRISKRKNKNGELTYTMEAASVELTLPDKTAFPGKNREINEKIKEILGVDAGQFTQISMIAQGEFLKLLHAPSKERKEIFARLFDTRIYEHLQSGLKEQSSALEKELKENKFQCMRELSDVRCMENSGWNERWQELLAAPETGKDELFELLESILLELARSVEGLKRREEENQKEADLVKAGLDRAKDINRLFTQSEENTESIRQLRQRLGQLQQEKETGDKAQKMAAEAYRSEAPKRDREIAEYSNMLPKYEELDKRQAKAAQLIMAGKQTKIRRQQMEEQEKKAEAEAVRLKESQEILSEETERLPKLQQKAAACRERGQRLLEMTQMQEAQQKLERELEQKQEDVKKALDDWQEKGRIYEQNYRVFIGEQAGLLADGLTEGRPCPVCGSLHHPDKARLSRRAVTQQQVEYSRKEREKAEELLNQKREAFQAVKEQREAGRQILFRDGMRLFGEEFQPMQLPQALEDCKMEWNGLKDEVRKLEQKKQQFQTQKQQLKRAEEVREDARKKKEAAAEELHEEKLAYEKAKQALDDIKESLSCESRDALLKQLDQVKKERQRLEQDMRAADQRVQLTAQETAKAEGTLTSLLDRKQQLDQDLEGKARPDISALKQRELVCREQKEALEQQKLALLSLKNRNSQARESLTGLYDKRERLKMRFELVDHLSRTANGNLRQQARLDLQTYVQRRYFKHIIGEANKRLTKMSGEQFLLRCRELEQLGKQGEAGLDLDVYDLITDRTRDVKTLSGGESFLAALAMALGLADVIRQEAGSVRLDTMFIDEGFGSLDEEARGRAIGILNELAGETRLVGIISHVTELKEQLDKKLVISKGEKGSRTEWVLES